MAPLCPNCNEPLSSDGYPVQYKLGGYYESWRCYMCHISVTVLPIPNQTLNPFDPASPGAQTQSYEDYERGLPDYMVDWDGY